MVLLAKDPSNIELELLHNRKNLILPESSLDKVLPSVGGKVLILSSAKSGIIHKINLNDHRVIVKTQDGKEVELKISDVCKLN